MDIGVAARLRIAVVVVAAVLAFAGACAVQLAPARAAATKPDPPSVRHVTITLPTGDTASAGTQSDLTVQADDEVNLHPGDIVELTFGTQSPVGLLGLTVHLCQTGFQDWDDSTFGYAGQSGTRCVYQPGIIQGT